MKKKFITTVFENVKTIIAALIIAIIIRSLIFQPFYIPSSSMEPTLLIGDRIFVSKYSYGYSKHSFPFSPNISSNRFFYNLPKQGDLVVFKTPSDNRTDYIKRLIGLPGDEIQFKNGEIFINNKSINRNNLNQTKQLRCGKSLIDVNTYEETLPNGVKHLASYNKIGSLKNTKKFKVPVNHFFLLGDNRDCSKDSRYLGSVGYVKKENLVGKARVLFFSSDYRIGSIFKFWDWNEILRLNRFFKTIK